MSVDSIVSHPHLRTAFETLGRDRLGELTDELGLRVLDRRVLAHHIDAILKAPAIDLRAVLLGLPRTELQAMCDALGIDRSGREKAPLVERILAHAGATPAPQGVLPLSGPTPTPRTPAAPPPTASPAPAASPAVKAKASEVRKLTLAQLERHLFGAADDLRGKMDASEFKEYIFGMLFLKRCSDEFAARREAVIREQLQRGRTQAEAELRANHPSHYGDTFFVPEIARWEHLRDNLHHNVGDGLNKALGALEEHNPQSLKGVLHHIDFTRTVGRSRLPDKKLRDLIQRFNRYRMRNEDFEFPDLLGAAYEFLIGEFADSAGKKGGEFYTPRSVVRMMVRIANPKPGTRVYDPCSGSGGMLILARDHVAEHGGNPRDLALYGQESNGGVWSISKMNMILHGIPDADLQNGDTLAEPLHTTGGELTRFDTVLSNPPFSQNYSAEGIPFPTRFSYGMCPESGKKADLMFVQHMVAVLRAQGMVCTVMPHGVLFRGGAERAIRKGFIDHDLLDAVIGLAPNLFYGTGIPACILVLRAEGSRPPERQGKVLFINADAEFRAGRAQNYLDPEHIEKVVSAYERFVDIPGFAAVVSRKDLAANDYNLNIRRYADNAPAPEPHDVRAHLLGGVPRAEVEGHRGLFTAQGFDPMQVLTARDDRYYDFHAGLKDRKSLKRAIETDAGISARERALADVFDTWWSGQQHAIEALPQTANLMSLRTALLASFVGALSPVGLLDRYQLVGAAATWWGEVLYDLKTLMAGGFEGSINGWVTTIVTGLDDEGAKASPLDHKLVRRLMGSFLTKIEAAEGRVAELDGALKAATATEGDGDEGDGDEGDADASEERASEEEIREMKRALTAAKGELKKLHRSFAEHLEQARAALTTEEAKALVLAIFKDDLARELTRRVAAQRGRVVAVVDGWWEKYRVTLRDLEAERDASRAKLAGFLRELGYE